MASIRNPILPGFNPDPSICRVGDDFYVATSTFEWFPGVQIHHSRDLVHWRLAARPLAETRLLDMRGNPDSGGIWAPCLSHRDGLFWLIYTDVKHLDGAFKDTPNLLTTAPSIEGPWSDPVFLNSSGFDPSLFHDDDGRKWLVNQIWDHRPGRNRFAGIALQEYDPKGRRLVGPIRNIFKGSSLGVTEGPHLYRWRGCYYLVTAEGGTGWNHAVSVARSRSLEGPYEIDPCNPIVTSKDRPGNLLQKAGHASICDAPDGSWWLVHLASRPVGEQRRCILGRETSIQRLAWTEDGWLRLAGGGSDPRSSVEGPALPAHPWPVEPERVAFDGPQLPACFQTLRNPADASWLSLNERPGHLRLRGRHSPTSRFDQSLVARRLTSLRCSAETRLDCAPEDFQQMAGLMAFYDCDSWYYLRVTHDEERGRVLSLAFCDDGAYGEHSGQLALPAACAPALGFDLDHERLQFRCDLGQGWAPFGPVLDATRLSDDYGKGWNFTGAWAALAAHDVSGRRLVADFADFSYRTA